MSNYNINNNPVLKDKMLEKYLSNEEKAKHNPKSVLPSFKQELLDLGFSFQTINQAEKLMPKHKKDILPVVIKYYKAASIPSEKRYLLQWFHHKGLETVVPMLLQDFFSDNANVDRWSIGDRLYQIRSPRYADEYLEIISNAKFGKDRQMVILLVGKLKIVQAIPQLIELLEDEDVRLHAISALGEFKNEALRSHFERFKNSKHPGWRKSANAALKKLDE